MEHLKVVLLVVCDIDQFNEFWSHIIAQIFHSFQHVGERKFHDRYIVVHTSSVGRCKEIIRGLYSGRNVVEKLILVKISKLASKVQAERLKKIVL